MKSQVFGKLPSGETAHLYTLEGGEGFSADITNYGGIVTALRVPDHQGKVADVVLGFGSLEKYLGGHPYFGAITGRVAGRLTGGQFELEGRRYQLAVNNPPNHLHGGVAGLDKRLWRAEVAGRAKLKLSYLSPDGEEGYPGNVQLTVEYSLTSARELIIECAATTDQATLINLTHHSYFNLAGEGRGDTREHRLTIFADRFTPTDEQLTLRGFSEPVSGANDFREEARVGERVERLWRQHGDNYLIRRDGPGLSRAARLRDPRSGRSMEVRSSDPCLQFYAGKFLDGSLIGKSGQPYGSHAGLCLECQRFPNAIGRTEFDSIELRPGEIYRQSTVYRFSAETPAS